MRWLLLLSLVACKKNPPEAAPVESAPVAATGDKPAPSVAQLQGVARQLAAHDGPPDCAAIEAELAADPVATWLYVVNTVSMPPATPMRAAGCLIRLHPEAAADAMVQWVTTPGFEGLGKLVLAELPSLPEPVAVRVVEAGLRGGLAAEVRGAAAAAPQAGVQALGATP